PPTISTTCQWLTRQGSVAGLLLGASSTSEIFDTYFDTDDWRLHRAGYALRIRSEAGKSEATLKSLHAVHQSGLADRRELTESLPTRSADCIALATGPVGSRVHAVSGQHELQPLFEVHTSRERYAVRVAEGEPPVGEIALDDTVIARPRGEP